MKKNINLYTVYKVKQTKQKSVGSFLNLFAIVLIVSLLVGAVGLRLMLTKTSILADNNALKKYIQSASSAEVLQEIKEQQTQISALETLKESLVNAQAIIDKKDNLDQEFIDKLYSLIPAGVAIKSLNISLPTVMIEVSYATQAQVNDYILKLKGIGDVKSISSTHVNLIEERFETVIVMILGGAY